MANLFLVGMIKSKMLNEADRNVVSQYFYSEGVAKRLPDLIDKFPDLSKDDLEEWYDNQKIVQVMRAPQTHLKEYAPIISFILGERLYIDTMFFNLKKTTVCVINGIEWFSRYGVACVVVVKKDQSIGTRHTVQALEQFLDEFEKMGVKISNVITDNGSEYLGAFHQKVMDLGMKHHYTEKGDVVKNSPIEAANRVLRKMVEAYRESHVLGIPSSWGEAVKVCLSTYNRLKHSALDKNKYTPLEVIENRKAQNAILDYNWMRKALWYEDKGLEILENDTWVRYYTRNTESKGIRKLKRNWSVDLYKVSGYDSKSQMYSIQGVDRKYRREHLLVVDKDKYDVLNSTPEKEQTIQEIRERQQQEARPRREKRVRITKDVQDVLNQPMIEGPRQRKKNPRYND